MLMIDENSGVAMISAERDRQKSVEGWTTAHDDQHIHAELLDAAICYTRTALWLLIDKYVAPFTVENGAYWPFGFDWWKPSADPVRNLVKAGALIAAEIDRLNRIKEKRGE